MFIELTTSSIRIALMLKYTQNITTSKSIARSMVAQCRPSYNKGLAWWNKAAAKNQQKATIKAHFHNWLYEQSLQVIDTKNPAPAVTTVPLSVTKKRRREIATV